MKKETFIYLDTIRVGRWPIKFILGATHSTLVLPEEEDKKKREDLLNTEKVKTDSF